MNIFLAGLGLYQLIICIYNHIYIYVIYAHIRIHTHIHIHLISCLVFMGSDVLFSFPVPSAFCTKRRQDLVSWQGQLLPRRTTAFETNGVKINYMMLLYS